MVHVLNAAGKPDTLQVKMTSRVSVLLSISRVYTLSMEPRFREPGIRFCFALVTSFCNIKSEMRSFKSNENIHKKEGGSYYVVSANKASSVTL